MKSEIVLGIVRHALTFAGGVLVMTGKVDDGLVQEAIGAVVTTVGLLWSMVQKVNTAK